MIPRVAVIIPFRDRGTDPLRQANLTAIRRHWRGYTSDALAIVTDGRNGDDQFNRSAAYNLGVRMCPEAQVYVFTESDMLIEAEQINQAVELALSAPGLIVPFTQYRYLSEDDSAAVRAGQPPASVEPEWTMDNGRSVGAINVLSAETMALVGQFDEVFEGSWYDDRAMARAFDITAGPTRYVDGPGYHLYHRPGWAGPNLTPEDRAATARNRARFALYAQAATPERIRQLTAGDV